MKVVAIVQARMNSLRLPGKVMQRIDGVPMIELLLARLGKSREVEQVIVATSSHPSDQPLAEHVAGLGLACERGSESDVLERYLQAAERHEADAVVRITGDCPLVDAQLVDACVRRFKEEGLDYLSNAHPPSYPDGLDVEVVKTSALRRARRESHDPFDREHVTPFVRESGLFATAAMPREEASDEDEDCSKMRWTVDEPEDFEVIANVFRHFSPELHFGWREVLQLQRKRPQLFAANQHIVRNEGAALGAGGKLWRRARRVIPGGNMLLSKRPEMFLPGAWPAYFTRAKGCRVWDLEGKPYVDMSLMGVGANVLGYAHPEVDAAVGEAVRMGNMSTLNCPEEVRLAEKLIELHPWAEMARFARSGGEANAIAVRIARAASGRDRVAFCGYHGWHDWYLSANLGADGSLDEHLLPGLQPKGVPRALRGTALPFSYNRFEQLEALAQAHDLAAVVMEVTRNEPPQDGFLRKVRELCAERGIALIFDECTSGFRECLGGLHKRYGVDPDMAIFGKALGNGYAISAVIGRREIMQAAQSTFISSTFWSERIGPCAALGTLQVMEREKSWQKVVATGEAIRGRWRQLAQRHGLQLAHWGLPSLAGFNVVSEAGNSPAAYKTLISQEMLVKGYLAANSVYVCTEHTPEIVDGYFAALDPVFALIKRCEEGEDVARLLVGEACHSGFKRLN